MAAEQLHGCKEKIRKQYTDLVEWSIQCGTAEQIISTADAEEPHGLRPKISTNRIISTCRPRADHPNIYDSHTKMLDMLLKYETELDIKLKRLNDLKTTRWVNSIKCKSKQQSTEKGRIYTQKKAIYNARQYQRRLSIGSKCSDSAESQQTLDDPSFPSSQHSQNDDDEKDLELLDQSFEYEPLSSQQSSEYNPQYDLSQKTCYTSSGSSSFLSAESSPAGQCDAGKAKKVGRPRKSKKTQEPSTQSLFMDKWLRVKVPQTKCINHNKPNGKPMEQQSITAFFKPHNKQSKRANPTDDDIALLQPSSKRRRLNKTRKNNDVPRSE